MHARASGLLGTKVGGVHIPQQAEGRPILQPRGMELLIQLDSVPGQRSVELLHLLQNTSPHFERLFGFSGVGGLQLNQLARL